MFIDELKAYMKKQIKQIRPDFSNEKIEEIATTAIEYIEMKLSK